MIRWVWAAGICQILDARLTNLTIADSTSKCIPPHWAVAHYGHLDRTASKASSRRRLSSCTSFGETWSTRGQEKCAVLENALVATTNGGSEGGKAIGGGADVPAYELD